MLRTHSHFLLFALSLFACSSSNLSNDFNTRNAYTQSSKELSTSAAAATEDATAKNPVESSKPDDPPPAVQPAQSLHEEENDDEEEPQDPPPPLRAPNNAPSGPNSETFTITKAILKTKVLRPLHMLWVIDGSGSMNDEKQAVELGLRTFVNELATYDTSKVQTTVIGELSDTATSTLSNAGIHIVRSKVASYDQLEVVASYIAKNKGYTKNAYGFSEDRACKPAPTSPLRSAVPPSRLDDHPSSTFFRDPEALKVLIVVSDEGECLCWPNWPSNGRHSYHFASACLSRFMRDKLPDPDMSKFRFFGFVDLKTPARQTKPNIDKFHAMHSKAWDPKGYNTNNAYQELVDEFGGKLFHISDISPAQWHGVFDEAKDILVSEVQQNTFSYTLKATPSKILSITLDGKPLAASAFTLTQSKLTITAPNAQSGDSVVVEYEL